MEIPPEDEVRRAFRLATIMSIAPFFSILVLGGIGEALRRTGAPMPLLDEPRLTGTMLNALRILFWGLSIGSFFLIGWLRKLILEERISTGMLSFPGRPYSPPLRRLLNAGMLIWICDLPSTLALVLFLLSGKAFDLYGLLGLALVIGVFYFPRYDEWAERINESANPRISDEAIER